jgi:hypothetical protein
MQQAPHASPVPIFSEFWPARMQGHQHPKQQMPQLEKQLHGPWVQEVSGAPIGGIFSVICRAVRSIGVGGFRLPVSWERRRGLDLTCSLCSDPPWYIKLRSGQGSRFAPRGPSPFPGPHSADCQKTAGERRTHPLSHNN